MFTLDEGYAANQRREKAHAKGNAAANVAAEQRGIARGLLVIQFKPSEFGENFVPDYGARYTGLRTASDLAGAS